MVTTVRGVTIADDAPAWGGSTGKLPAPDTQPMQPRLSGTGSLRPELEALLAGARPTSTLAELRALVVQHNVTGKRTEATRKITWKYLRPRYALDPAIAEYRDFGQPGSHASMMTQQSWLFLRSFAALGRDVLEKTSVMTLAHLGEHAFDEQAAAGAFVARFTLCTAPPAAEHRLTAFRLIGPKSPVAKDMLLREAVRAFTPSGPHPSPPPAGRERGVNLNPHPTPTLREWDGKRSEPG